MSTTRNSQAAAEATAPRSLKAPQLLNSLSTPVQIQTSMQSLPQPCPHPSSSCIIPASAPALHTPCRGHLSTSGAATAGRIRPLRMLPAAPEATCKRHALPSRCPARALQNMLILSPAELFSRILGATEHSTRSAFIQHMQDLAANTLLGEMRVPTLVAARLRDSHRRAVYRSAARVTTFRHPPFEAIRRAVKLEFLS